MNILSNGFSDRKCLLTPFYDLQIFITFDSSDFSYFKQKTRYDFRLQDLIILNHYHILNEYYIPIKQVNTRILFPSKPQRIHKNQSYIRFLTLSIETIDLSNRLFHHHYIKNYKTAIKRNYPKCKATNLQFSDVPRLHNSSI